MRIKFNTLSNTQIEDELGKRLKRCRVGMRLNQSELAGRAGVSRRTITAVESGKGCTMGTFIALLRALGVLHELDDLLPDPGVSPIAVTNQRVRERKYPYKARSKKKQPPWQWGDEQ